MFEINTVLFTYVCLKSMPFCLLMYVAGRRWYLLCSSCPTRKMGRGQVCTIYNVTVHTGRASSIYVVLCYSQNCKFHHRRMESLEPFNVFFLYIILSTTVSFLDLTDAILFLRALFFFMYISNFFFANTFCMCVMYLK